MLQLRYMRPEATWMERLVIWDSWHSRFPEEGLQQTFHNKRGMPLIAEQRAKRLRQETVRASKRALKFLPFFDAAT